MEDDKIFLDPLFAFEGGIKDDEPSEELYRRIITVVPAMKQQAPVPASPPAFLRFFGEWHYLLEFKCAALAVFALAGFFIGQSEWQLLGHETFFSAIVNGDISWEN